MFELEEVATQEVDMNSTVIKVVGVGGAGGNAVDHMIREGVSGVEFICCNTDAQALKKSSAHVKLQLGPGLGAGGKPEACGWIKDRYGLSWQITPRALTEAIGAGGEEARRAFEAMMDMRKIDVATIEAARRG